MKILAVILAADDADAARIADIIRAPDLAGLRAVLLDLRPPEWWETAALPFTARAKSQTAPTPLYWAPGGAVRRNAPITWPVQVFERADGGWLRVVDGGDWWARAGDLEPA